MNNPLVSVIMPVRNSSYVLEAIESILHQSYTYFEIIIIDDASVDRVNKKLPEKLDKRIRLLRNAKLSGVAASLNSGIRLARGKFIARMDADDVASPDRLEKQVGFLTKHPAVGVVGSWVEEIDDTGRKIGIERLPATHQEILKALVWSNPLRHPAVMIRHKLVNIYGGYDETLDGAEDYDLWLRLAQKTQLANISEVLLKYRLSQGSVSYKENKRIERAFMLAKIKSVTHYGYPWWHLLVAIKSFGSQVVPVSMKRALYRELFNYR